MSPSEVGQLWNEISFSNVCSSVGTVQPDFGTKWLLCRVRVKRVVMVVKGCW